jgi:hypothetical protein
MPITNGMIVVNKRNSGNIQPNVINMGVLPPSLLHFDPATDPDGGVRKRAASLQQASQASSKQAFHGLDRRFHNIGHGSLSQ